MANLPDLMIIILIITFVIIYDERPPSLADLANCMDTIRFLKIQLMKIDQSPIFIDSIYTYTVSKSQNYIISTLHGSLASSIIIELHSWNHFVSKYIMNDDIFVITDCKVILTYSQNVRNTFASKANVFIRGQWES